LFRHGEYSPSTGANNGTNTAYSNPIATYICPNSPAPSTINYWNAQWTGSGNGSGPANPSPPTQIWGLTDYFAIPGFHCDLIALLGVDPKAGTPGYFCKYCNNEPGGISSPSNSTGNPVGSFTDGTSNCLIVGEMSARPIGYNKFRQIYTQNGQTVDGVLYPCQGGGGAWADPFSYAHLAGSQPSGIRGVSNLAPGQAPCMVNCSTDNELYSFHVGGVYTLFADGSVHFINENINPVTLVYLVCRNDGNVAGEY
jgi:hypothetical protein